MGCESDQAQCVDLVVLEVVAPPNDAAGAPSACAVRIDEAGDGVRGVADRKSVNGADEHRGKTVVEFQATAVFSSTARRAARMDPVVALRGTE